MEEYFRLAIEDDRTGQVAALLRQALGLLEPRDAAFRQVERALILAERDWRRARARLEGVERARDNDCAQDDYMLETHPIAPPP